MEGVGGDPHIPLQTARRNADSLGINYDALPQMPFWSPLFGKSSDYFKTRVAAKVMTSSASVGRELTQPEKDAMSYHFAKLLVTVSYESPLAVAATYGLERTTRPKFGFPFYNPNPATFSNNKFPGLPEGRFSYWAWQGTRVLAWYVASKLAIGLVATSYAISVYQANTGRDNRLEAYRRDLARRGAASGRLERGRANPQGPLGQSNQQYSQQKWEGPTSATEPVSWPSSEQERKAAPTSSPTPWAAAQSSQTAPQDAYNQDPDVFDDVSPVAPSEQGIPSPQDPSQQGGSAWDRIRGQAQAARNQPGSWAKKRQDEMTSRGAQDGTSYDYSTADEEKVFAKDQAQKEFDEMLERERRGHGR